MMVLAQMHTMFMQEVWVQILEKNCEENEEEMSPNGASEALDPNFGLETSPLADTNWPQIRCSVRWNQPQVKHNANLPIGD
jgi:hypothetical protein